MQYEKLIKSETDLQILMMKTFDGQLAFSYGGAAVRNALGSHVKQASSFKHKCINQSYSRTFVLFDADF